MLDEWKQSIPYILHLVNMHAQDFQEPKEDTIWTKLLVKAREHTKVWSDKRLSKLYQIIKST
jgi:hypothetical protein